MSDISYPTGWYGKPETVDEKSLKILTIVRRAGDDISYKEAKEMLEKEVKDG